MADEDFERWHPPFSKLKQKSSYTINDSDFCTVPVFARKRR